MQNLPEKSRAVIDISDIDISIKISCDIDIDTEIVDMDILELGVTSVLDLSSLTINILKIINYSETMLIDKFKKLVWLMCLVALSSLAFMSLQFRFFGSGKHSFIELLMNYFLWSFSLNYD